jgi:hypothetical protein
MLLMLKMAFLVSSLQNSDLSTQSHVLAGGSADVSSSLSDNEYKS